ncbi:MAG: glucan biosynthesis protein [Terrimicrobiaceae bacterium]|nr:glucan biosynthesis protein [Terrimicrobiaceae bacterium]
MKTHLVFAAMTIALLAFVISQSGRKTITFETIVGIARDRSREDFEPPKSRVSAALRGLNYDQSRDIRYKEDGALWRREGLPFQIRFFITSGEHTAGPVTIFQVHRDVAGQVVFSPDQFTFGPLVNIPDADKAASDYSGFRIYYPLDKPDRLDETLVFQGASYFRPRARGQIYGISARGVAINTLGAEDFPAFTTFWLVRPSPGASEMKLYALLEGRDLTGAYEFRLSPGEQTAIHVRATLFARNRVNDIGIASLTSMFWYGENTSNTFGNWRPEVHDSDGLQIQRGNGEWLWHPLAWAKQRQVNAFADVNPKGFGLFQRDRDFTHYQDLEANYHLRPSAWVQPDGDWGAGAVVLMQNATSDEFQDNVVAYWRPEEGLRPGHPLSLAYSLLVFTQNSALPPLAACISTRIDYKELPNYRWIYVDFAGAGLDGLPPDAKILPEIWVGAPGILSNAYAQKIPNTNTWRVTFGVTASETGNPVEMRCSLARDGKPLTETWAYTWVK